MDTAALLEAYISGERLFRDVYQLLGYIPFR
jgi:hypothetical protein